MVKRAIQLLALVQGAAALRMLDRGLEEHGENLVSLLECALERADDPFVGRGGELLGRRHGRVARKVVVVSRREVRCTKSTIHLGIPLAACWGIWSERRSRVLSPGSE